MVNALKAGNIIPNKDALLNYTKMEQRCVSTTVNNHTLYTSRLEYDK